MDEYMSQCGEDERLAVIAFLHELLLIPECIRDCWVDEDGNIVNGPDS